MRARAATVAAPVGADDVGGTSVTSVHLLRIERGGGGESDGQRTHAGRRTPRSNLPPSDHPSSIVKLGKRRCTGGGKVATPARAGLTALPAGGVDADPDGGGFIWHTVRDKRWSQCHRRVHAPSPPPAANEAAHRRRRRRRARGMAQCHSPQRQWR